MEAAARELAQSRLRSHCGQLMNNPPLAVVNGMSATEIEITDDHTPEGPSNSLRLVVWVRHEDSPEKMGTAAKTAAMDFLERALADLRRG